MRRVGRDVVPDEKSFCSMRAIDRPRNAASLAMPAPMMPPPMTRRSTVWSARDRTVSSRPTVLSGHERRQHRRVVGRKHVDPRFREGARLGHVVRVRRHDDQSRGMKLIDECPAERAEAGVGIRRTDRRTDFPHRRDVRVSEEDASWDLGRRDAQLDDERDIERSSDHLDAPRASGSGQRAQRGAGALALQFDVDADAASPRQFEDVNQAGNALSAAEVDARELVRGQRIDSLGSSTDPSQFLIATGATIAAAACATPPAGQGAPTGGAPLGTVKLSAWTIGPDAPSYYRRDNLVAAADKLNAKLGSGTNVQVDATFESGGQWGDYLQQFTLAAEAKTSPDIILAGHENFAPWVGPGYIVPLDDLIAKYQSEGDIKDVIPTLWTAMKLKGKTYGIPQDTEARPMYYRKDLLAKMGWSKDM